jgi:hypothetical protein
VLAAALAFEATWRWARGTSAVAPGAARPRGREGHRPRDLPYAGAPGSPEP